MSVILDLDLFCLEKKIFLIIFWWVFYDKIRECKVRRFYIYYLSYRRLKGVKGKFVC